MSIEHIQINRETLAQLFKLPKDMTDYLWECIDVAKKKKINMKNNLAGHISHSYKLEDPQNLIIEKVVNVAFNQVDNPRMFNFINGELRSINRKVAIHPTSEMKPCLHDLWVNFQKKYEFQPIHNHSSLMSFVIWMDIPYDWKDEAKLPFAKMRAAGPPSVGNFAFVFSKGNCRNVSGYTISMSPEMNGYCCFFPSDLCHQVYPFYTSDKERISISGNIILKPALAESQPPVVRAVDQTSFIISNT